MTNGKVYQGFHNDKKIEEHYFKVSADLRHVRNLCSCVYVMRRGAVCRIDCR